MKEIIITQKEERNEILAANYVPRKGADMFRAALSNKLIKVITGPRRAGKSVFAVQSLKGVDFAYINFDDERLLGILNGANNDEIIKGVRQVYGDTQNVLFDEIQNVPKWELFLSRLERRGYNIVVTGSNSRLLSKELATHLTGRHLQFTLLPLSFEEAVDAKGFHGDLFETREKQGEILGHLGEYIRKGGYPEVVVNGVEHKNYCKTLFDSIILRDIVERHKIRNAHALKALGYYLLTHHSAPTSLNEISAVLKLNSVTTVGKYIAYLEEAFLLFSAVKFSFKVKEQIKSQKKFYGYDTGMVDAVKFKSSADAGRLLENIVAIELKRRRYHEELYYYRASDGKEVDFVIKEGAGVAELMQVCFDLSNPKTEKREISALVAAAGELRCNSLSIVTWDDERILKKAGMEIRLVPVAKWLLGQS